MYMSERTAFQCLVDEFSNYYWGDPNIDYSKYIDFDDLQLLQNNIMSRNRNNLPCNSDIGEVLKIQIEFTNIHRYIFTFSLIHDCGTPGCCALYEMSYTKDRFLIED